MRTDFQAGYETAIKAPIEKVWDVLTNPDMVRQYFFGTELNTTWKIGDPISFRGEFDQKSYIDKGLVREYVPMEMLSYTYLSSFSNMEDKPENYLLVSYQVKSLDDETTELKITQSNYDEEKAKHCSGNWKAVIDELKKLVE